MLKRVIGFLLVLTLLVPYGLAMAERGFQVQDKGVFDENTAYILNPPTVPAEPAMQHEFINILLMGVDYGIAATGIGKSEIKNCHTDSVIMVAIDLTDSKISLISVPRDTLTYVPGAYGVYKLNAAINCAETFDEGIQSVQDTVSWLLGGIRPDHYMIISPHLVEEIGNKIGGLDLDVEMSYIGHSGTRYQRGFQHLDGVGIMDYSRSRRNATRNNNDYGRTNRQRVVLNALYQKISQEPDLLYEALDVVVENFDRYFFSDMSAADMLDMLPLAAQISSGSIKGYEMGGDLSMAMKYFNSSFFDQKKRQSVLKEVYGVDIPAQRLNSHGYLNYLFKYGFDGVKAVRVTSQLIDWARKAGYTGEALDKAVKARKDFIEALSAVDDKRERTATLKVDRTTGALKQAAISLKNACGYPEKLVWRIVEEDKWYMDSYINQYNEIDWR